LSLAAFAADLQYADIPAAARDHVKSVLLDTVACAFAGYAGDETRQIKALAEALGNSKESSV
jgi:2-methylcitrate dehydratase PrpD